MPTKSAIEYISGQLGYNVLFASNNDRILEMNRWNL